MVLSIKQSFESPFSFIQKLKDRITSSDIATFTRQLATMVAAGLPITESLLILKTQSKGPMGKIVSQILADIEGGESMSKAFIKHKNIHRYLLTPVGIRTIEFLHDKKIIE